MLGSAANRTVNERDLDSLTRSRNAQRIGYEANSLAADRDYYGAIKKFEEAIRYDNSDARFFLNRSFCYAQLELYQLALDDAQQAIALNPELAKCYYRKGQALVGLKKYWEAEAAFKDVLRYEPECAETKQELFKVRFNGLVSIGFDGESSALAAQKYESLAMAREALVVERDSKGNTSKQPGNGLVNHHHHHQQQQLNSNSLFNNANNQLPRTNEHPMMDMGLWGSAWKSDNVIRPSPNAWGANDDYGVFQHQSNSTKTIGSNRINHSSGDSALSAVQSMIKEGMEKLDINGTKATFTKQDQMEHKMLNNHRILGGGDSGNLIGPQPPTNGQQRSSLGEIGSGQHKYGNHQQQAHVPLLIGATDQALRTVSSNNNALLDNGHTSSTKPNGMLTTNNHLLLHHQQQDQQPPPATIRPEQLTHQQQQLPNTSNNGSSTNNTESINHDTNSSPTASQYSAFGYNFAQAVQTAPSSSQSCGQQSSSPSLGSTGSNEPSVSPGASFTSTDSDMSNSNNGRDGYKSNNRGTAAPPSNSNGSASFSYSDMVKRAKHAAAASEGNDKPDQHQANKNAWNKTNATNNDIKTVKPNSNDEKAALAARRPTNLWGYWGLRVTNISNSCSKAMLQNLFGKFGRIKLIERINNKSVENQIWVYYDNATSPVDAVARLQGLVIENVCVNGEPLRMYFAPTDEQKELKFSRPKQPPDNKGECYYWRTTNCFSREQCSLLHLPPNKNIDAQVWMKMNKEPPSPSPTTLSGK